MIRRSPHALALGPAAVLGLWLAACGGAQHASQPAADEGTGSLPPGEVAPPEARWTPSTPAVGTCRVRAWHDAEERRASPDTPLQENETEFDSRGRLVRERGIRSTAGDTWTRTYRYDDATDRPLSSISDQTLANGTAFHTETTFTYEVDAARHVVVQTVSSTQDDEGEEDGEETDEEDEQGEEDDPPHTVTYQFDADGRLSSVEDHDGGPTTTTRCLWEGGRVSETREVSSAGPDRVHSYVYDRDGHLLGSTIEGLPESAGSPGGHRDFVVTDEGGRMVERALAPPPALLSVIVYEGACAPLMFDSCDPATAFLAE